jgi:hypothetical protein
VTVEHSLVGAMGCASWRSHCQLRERAELPNIPRAIRGRASLAFGRVGALDLNEVGVTDTALAAIWRFGPIGAAYAVSSHAEAQQLGADIAIVRAGARRILLYQAKLAEAKDGLFSLKSAVTRKQLGLLRRVRVVEIQGKEFQLTARLALYQQDVTSYLSSCPPGLISTLSSTPWLCGPGPLPPGAWLPIPEIGRDYYRKMLVGHGWSPGGILAAHVPAKGKAIKSVPVANTWPWEFDTYRWLLSGGPREADLTGAVPEFGGPPPVFEDSQGLDDEPLRSPPINAQPTADLADAIHGALRLSSNVGLYTIIVP